MELLMFLAWKMKWKINYPVLKPPEGSNTCRNNDFSCLCPITRSATFYYGTKETSLQPQRANVLFPCKTWSRHTSSCKLEKSPGHLSKFCIFCNRPIRGVVHFSAWLLGSENWVSMVRIGVSSHNIKSNL